MDSIERKGLAVEFKAGDKGEFTARIVTLNIPDKDGDVTPPGAFPPATDVLVSAYGHASWGGALPVGVARIQESGQEVLADGRFNLATAIGRDTYETVKFSGPLQEWSYGFKVLESGQDTIDGKLVRVLKRVQPFEVSPVLKGAGVLTATLGIKADSADSLARLAAIINESREAVVLRLKSQALTPAHQSVLSAHIRDLESLLRDLKALNTPPPDAASILAYLTTKARLMATA